MIPTVTRFFGRLSVIKEHRIGSLKYKPNFTFTQRRNKEIYVNVKKYMKLILTFCLLFITLASQSLASPYFCDPSSNYFQERNQQKWEGQGRWVHNMDIYALGYDGRFSYDQSSVYYQHDWYNEMECQFGETQYYDFGPGVVGIVNIDLDIVPPSENKFSDPQRYYITFTTPSLPGSLDVSSDLGTSIQLNERTIGISFINSEKDITLQEVITTTVPGAVREYWLGVFQKVPVDENGTLMNKQVSSINFNGYSVESFPPYIEDAMVAWQNGEVNVDPNYGAYIFYYNPADYQ